MADKIIGLIMGLMLGSSALSLFYAFMKRRAYKEIEEKQKRLLIKEAHEEAEKAVEQKVMAASDDDLADLGNQLVRKLSGDKKD